MPSPHLPGAALLAALVAAAGCAAGPPSVWVHQVRDETSTADRIEARDSLLVEVRDFPNVSGEFPVRDDGHYQQPNAGSVRVVGLTPVEAARAVADRLKGVFVSPQVSVWISKRAPIRVNVVGEVKTPGAYELTRDRTVVAALAAAGWLSEFARRDRVFVVREGVGQRIRFLVPELTRPESHAAGFRLRDADVIVVE